jgi:ATP-binding cassette subfamily F protein uup
MSFKDRHALETLPARMEALQAEIARLGRVLSDPNLYARKPVDFAKATSALSTAQDALAAAEEQWLALELQREEIGG